VSRRARPVSFFVRPQEAVLSVQVIRLLRQRWELRGTLYFEFQPGVYSGQHWQPGSVFVYEEFWADLGTVVARHESRYGHYAFTPVAAPVWSRILTELDDLAADLKAADREGAALLLPALFRWFVPPEGLAWRRAALRYATLTRELAAWVREQLDEHEVVSVLGI
jgi:hypothetical protein